MAGNDNRIFGIGTTGLVGSRIAELLIDSHPISHFSSSTGFDITDPSTITPLLHDTDHDVVLLMAAKADVDGCEQDKELREDGAAWKMHVVGTGHVVEACKKTDKKLVYISTDFVFDGEHIPDEGYAEADVPNPINWYGETKYQGEKIVASSGIPYLIVRIAYPFRTSFAEKKDFVRAIRDRLQSGQEVRAITDHVMAPTFIDDIAVGLKKLIEKDATGIYHVVGSEFVSPFEATMQIAMTMGYDTDLIKPVTREDFFRDRAPRPFNLSLKNDKITKLGVKMRSFSEGLEIFSSP